MGAYLTYALDESGALVHVDNVIRGSRCKCVCPYCKSQLYAKNGGSVREHHFAHAQGHDCDGAYESSLHMLAKDVLSETGYIMLPDTYPEGFPTGLIRLHNIEIEKRDTKYGFIPDVEGVMDNGERLLIEFYVSHRVDAMKRKEIVANGLKCIEIDIGYMSLNKEKLKAFLTGSTRNRKWIVPLLEKKDGNKKSSSFSSGRNPSYLRIRDLIKELFDKETLVIDVPNDHYTFSSYDLKKYEYDTCAIGGRFHRFKSDIVLYRSKEEHKGYISINFRGKRRSDDFQYPEGLRIIDVIIPSPNEEFLLKQISKGCVSLKALFANGSIIPNFRCKSSDNSCVTNNTTSIEYDGKRMDPESEEAQELALHIADLHAGRYAHRQIPTQGSLTEIINGHVKRGQRPF